MSFRHSQLWQCTGSKPDSSRCIWRKQQRCQLKKELCRSGEFSDATFYKSRQNYGGLGPSELRKLKQLEEENSKLKRIVADLSLDKAMLQDVLSKKL